MRRTILIVVASGCFLTAGAQAGTGTCFRNGNQLFDDCQDYEHAPIYLDKALKVTNCRSYVLGVVDALKDANEFCVPAASVQVNQVVDVVTLYLSGHPESRQWTASDLVVEARKEKFPCN